MEKNLMKLYRSTKGHCALCGITLYSNFGEPLGRYFMMDKQGQFYCIHCDDIFDDFDERIYMPEEDEE